MFSGILRARRKLLLYVVLPVFSYVGLHFLAREQPVNLWGVDMLAYYGPMAIGLFVLAPLLALGLPTPARCLQLANAARRWRGTGWVLAAVSMALFWWLRVRVHTLGDSVKWFAVVRNAIEHNRSFNAIAWHNASLDIPGLEFINVQQALDLVVHVIVYRGLHALGFVEAETTYALVGILAGGLYVRILWSLAGRLSPRPAESVALFAFFVSLGTLQLFCGYGESYTLVTLCSALYLIVALDCLRGLRPLWQPAVLLAVATATHMLALALTPSLLLLFWRDPIWGPRLRRTPVLLALGAVGVLAAWMAWDGLYSGLHLSLYSADAPGRYPLLSLRHAATLGNTLLLCAPFALLWGVIAAVTRRASPERQLFGLAALGTCALILIHDITMGGRDWDLMSFPALPLAVWGVVCLRQLFDDVTIPLARIVVPVMALHTMLWIGINASPARAGQRLEHLLLGDTNQQTHYRWWALGYYYLEQTTGREDDAAAAFAEAIYHAPKADLLIPGTRTFSYRKFYGAALALGGRHMEALREIRRVYAIDTDPAGDADDVSLHWDWARMSFVQAEAAAERGDTEAAVALWQESRRALERIITWRDSYLAHHDLATVLRRLGEHEQAITELYRGLSPDEDGVATLVDVGDDYLSSGQDKMPLHAYRRPMADTSWSAAQFVTLGTRLHKVGDRPLAIEAFRRAVARDPSRDLAYRNLGWLLLLEGKAAEAIPPLTAAVDLRASAENLYTRAFALLVAGSDKAEAAYSRAIERVGAEEGARVGAPHNLKWFIEAQSEVTRARQILQRHWPGRT